ncbi:MAG: c-type cytochrome, partial [Myxococcales bacterium]|nr:c-type cytochrome [Myxococcales bacterium]
LGPLFALNEMANPSVSFLLDTLRNAPDYAGKFEAAFGRGPDLPAIGTALAAYQRSLLSGDSPFDRWRYGGDASALSAQAQRGYALFTGRAGCVACHTIGEKDALFTDQALHNTGAGAIRPAAASPDPVHAEIMPGMKVPVILRPGASSSPGAARDLGRMAITDRPQDLYAFKTPSLRNVALTAPYMHDGSLRTLEEVVRFYNAGGGEIGEVDPRVRRLGLGDAAVADLVAFLLQLTGKEVLDLVADGRSGVVGN